MNRKVYRWHDYVLRNIKHSLQKKYNFVMHEFFCILQIIIALANQGPTRTSVVARNQCISRLTETLRCVVLNCTSRCQRTARWYNIHLAEFLVFSEKQNVTFRSDLIKTCQVQNAGLTLIQAFLKTS